MLLIQISLRELLFDMLASNKPHLFLSQFARVTTEGYDVLDTPYPKNNTPGATISNTYNIYGGDQKGASFGSNNTTNNN